jgi:hypothetical protein
MVFSPAQTTRSALSHARYVEAAAGTWNTSELYTRYIALISAFEEVLDHLDETAVALPEGLDQHLAHLHYAGATEARGRTHAATHLESALLAAYRQFLNLDTLDAESFETNVQHAVAAVGVCPCGCDEDIGACSCAECEYDACSCSDADSGATHD